MPSEKQPSGFQLQPGARPSPDYRLVARLGRGGFGEVWKADARGGFHVALKFVRLEDEGSPVELRALELVKEIRHPNLLATFAAWKLPEFLVIAMELADRTLRDRFLEAARGGLPGIPREELLEYLREAAKGIDHLNTFQHQVDGKTAVGVQHRDLKPANILLLGGGVKVADFGLARILEKTITGHTGAMTPSYAPPEFFGGKTSRQSDQYSLAVTYCELRGGRLPFTGSFTEIMAGHVMNPPDLTMLPAEERRAVARAMAKKPAERWPSCRAFTEAVAVAASVPVAAAATPAARPAQVRIPAPTTFSHVEPLSPPEIADTTPSGSDVQKTDPRAARPRGRINPRRWRGFAKGVTAVTVALLVGLAVWILRGNHTPEQTRKDVSTSPGTKEIVLIPPAPTARKMPAPEPIPTPANPANPARTKPPPLVAPFTEATARESQMAWADYLGRKVLEEIDLGDGVTMTFVLIPPGRFQMGSPEQPEKEEGRDSDEKQHEVEITRPFYLATSEVTRGQFRQFVLKESFQTEAEKDGFGGGGFNEQTEKWEYPTYDFDKGEFSGPGTKYNWKDTGFAQTDEHPVVNVSWNDAEAFCKWLDKKTGRTVRLPTEAQWEYACRAGTTTRFYCGNDTEELAEVGNVADGTAKEKLTTWSWSIKAKDGFVFTAPAGARKFRPNSFQLFDMHGNVWEWCADRYGEYEIDKRTNPEGPTSGNRRVLRGGSFGDEPGGCRAALRNSDAPVFRFGDVGFRPAFRLD